MLHFIRHSFLGGIATRSGLIITLGALLIAGGFFALLWFGLAIYAAVAIGVLLVLLAAVLTHRCVFSRMVHNFKQMLTLGKESILEPGLDFIFFKFWNPDCRFPINILSSVFAVLVFIIFLLLYASLACMISGLAFCLFNLIAVLLALLLSPLLMIFLASPVSLYFIVVPLLLLCAFWLITVILTLVSALLSCFGYDNKSDSMLRIAAPVSRLIVWGGCTILALFPTGLFVVYLLPSLVSTLTFTLPIWATYVGVTLLFGVVLCGVLLYCRQAVLNFRLSSHLPLFRWSNEPLPVNSIKVLLDQGAQCQIYRDLDSPLALVTYFLNYRLGSLTRREYKLLFVLLTKSLLYKGDSMQAPYYQGYSIQELITGTDEARPSLEVYHVALVKLLFECRKKYPRLYQHIKKVLLKWYVAYFVRNHCISPFVVIHNLDFDAAFSFEDRQRMSAVTLYSYVGGLACGRVFYQNDQDTWFICYYEGAAYQHKQITSEEHIQALKEYAPCLVSAPSKERGLAHAAFQRITDSIIAPSALMPLYDWTQEAKDILYYAVKSDLLSPKHVRYLLAWCSELPDKLFFLSSLNTGKKAALKDLIESFKVGREELNQALQVTLTLLPGTIAGLIVEYCESYPNPDTHPLPALDPDAVAATPAVG